MTTPAQDVSKTELAILEVLWDYGPSTRRRIADVLYPGGSDTHYATVQKLLERLEKKSCVQHERRERVLYFTPIVEREQLIQRRLLDVAEQLCDNSITPLMMNLVRARKLSSKEIDELRDLLESLRKETKPKKKSR